MKQRVSTAGSAVIRCNCPFPWISVSQGMGGKSRRESRIEVFFKSPFLKNRRCMSQDGAGKFLQGLGVFCEEIRNARAQNKREGCEAEEEATRKKPSSTHGRLTQRHTRTLRWNRVVHKFHQMNKGLPKGCPLDHTQKKSLAAR